MGFWGPGGAGVFFVGRSKYFSKINEQMAWEVAQKWHLVGIGLRGCGNELLSKSERNAWEVSKKCWLQIM